MNGSREGAYTQAASFSGCAGVSNCGARGGPARDPAAVEQYPAPARLVEEGLQQLDADLAVAGAVVEQKAVLGIEAALQPDPAVGRVVEQVDALDGDRRGLLAGGLTLEQLALLFAALELPEAQPDQRRQQREHQQAR